MKRELGFIATAVLLSCAVLFVGRSHDRHVHAAGQTPPNVCGTNQVVTSQLVNTGQSCTDVNALTTGVTSVTGTSPVVVTGTTAPAISCPSCLTSPGYIKGTSGTITGTLLAVGGTDSWTGAVTGALQGMRCGAVTTTDGTNPSTSVTLSCRCPSNGNVIVEVTAAAIATPATKSYGFVLFP